MQVKDLIWHLIGLDVDANVTINHKEITDAKTTITLESNGSINISTPLRKKKIRNVDATKYIPISEEDYAIGSANGIARNIITSRVRVCGWTIEEATCTVVHSPKLNAWIAKAELNGICKSTFLTRYHRLNWGLEKASTTPVIVVRSDIDE